MHEHANTHTQTQTDTHTSLLEIWLMMTHPYPCPRLIACTDTCFSFMFTGAFPLHVCGVTCNLRTYFTSVRSVFLVETVVLQTVVETVVLQTVLCDIRAWSTRFLAENVMHFQKVQKWKAFSKSSNLVFLKKKHI